MPIATTSLTKSLKITDRTDVAPFMVVDVHRFVRLAFCGAHADVVAGTARLARWLEHRR